MPTHAPSLTGVHGPPGVAPTSQEKKPDAPYTAEEVYQIPARHT